MELSNHLDLTYAVYLLHFRDSWRAIRIQKSLRSEGLKSQSYKDVASPVSSVSDSKKDRKKDIWTFDSSEEDDDDEDEDDIDLAELARALSEAATVAFHSKKQICGHQVTAETSTPNRAIRATDEKTPGNFCSVLLDVNCT